MGLVRPFYHLSYMYHERKEKAAPREAKGKLPTIVYMFASLEGFRGPSGYGLRY